MKITDIQVDGFGVWKGLTVESLSDDITVFVGQNEAGKTTLMQFIRSMMFGFSEERREKYIPPVYGGLAGGSVDVHSPLGAYEVQRHIDPNRVGDPVGDLAVTDTRDGAVHGREQLGALLADVDESIFNNVFAIGLREIQELGALNSTEAAEHLYRLTSGLDRVSLIDVMHNLGQRREKIWATDPKLASRLNVLSERRKKLHGEIDILRQRSKRWSQIAAQSTDVTNQLKDIADQITALEREARLVDISMQLSDRWQKRRALTEQIRTFGKLPDARDIQIEKLDHLNEKIVAQRERIGQIKSQRRTIKTEAQALPINRALWAQKAKIEAISEHSPWVESLERQVNKLEEDIARIENTMVGEVSGLGSQLKLKAKDVQDLENRGFHHLKTNGKKLTGEREKLKRLNQELEKAGLELNQHEEILGTSTADSASSTLEDTSRYVNRIRRRLELEKKIEKLNRSRHELERDIDGIVNEQVLPVEKLVGVGVVFIVGVILLGIGLLSNIWNGSTMFGQIGGKLGLLLMSAGIFCGLIAMGMKYTWERVAKDELDDFRHQMEIVRQQLKRAKTEREDIERQLPAHVQQWDLELQDAERRLAQMEDLIPLEKRVLNARAHLDEMRRRIKNQEHEVEAAEKVWKAGLRTAGLPDGLEPLHLEEISERSNRISGYHFRLDQFKNELVDRKKELDSIRSRIDLVCHETGIESKIESPLERLNFLLRSLNEQRALVNTRSEAATKYRNLRGKLAKAKRELDKSLGQKRRLLAKMGCDTEAEYREVDTKLNQRQELIQLRNSLTDQLKAGLGAFFAEDELSEYIESYGVGGLQKRAVNIRADFERLKEEQTKLIQQRGEFHQEIKMLGEDARMDEARLELNAIDSEIKQLKKEWQVMACTSQLLETIREGYESRRQPETLKEASTYLEQLTEGQYGRIWTKLVGEELLVDNMNDETITVEKLSRGTREAVFLSLRLALIGAYARRGAVLPLVLDDVLVNFDARRARSAAKLLCDFSRNGYQILMFSCHDHIRDMFHELGATVKVLPYHKEVVESKATPTDFRPVALPLEPVQVQEREIVPLPAYIPSESRIVLETNEYDPELEYELSAVVDDQQEEETQLRHELVYVSPYSESPIEVASHL